MNNLVYQIYYSLETKDQNDKGFIQLENLTNERPDWREYWPIRNFLLNTELDEDTRYGFLSPKFGVKTKLTSRIVADFVKNDESDIVFFSPFFDQTAFHFNVFEQLEAAHVGGLAVAQDCLKIIRPDVDIYSLIMDSRNTVYCNYFIANKKFWVTWFSYCETVFNIAESNDSDLARKLNTNVEHDGGNAPMKVFIIERMVSFILAVNKNLNVKFYNPMELPLCNAAMEEFKNELCVLDALKISFLASPLSNYAQEFEIRRRKLFNNLIKSISTECHDVK
jgi:hypothetical protein